MCKCITRRGRIMIGFELAIVCGSLAALVYCFGEASKTNASPLFGWGGIVFTIVFFLSAGDSLYRILNRSKIKGQLSIFLQQGDAIRRKCHNQKEPPPEQEAEDWAKEVATYLTKHLGEEYSARFYNSDGLPTGFTTLFGDHARIESFLRPRGARLQQFLSELGK